MKKTVLYFIFLLFAGTTANAQSTLDKLILEDAKTAYTNNNHKLCLEKIDELEKRGQKGLIILHLKIMATSKTNALFLSYEQVVQFKKDVAYYLKNYDNEDFMQKYKEVYEVSKTLSDKKYDEDYLILTKAIYNNDLFSLKGDIILVYFWASWSAPDRVVNKKIGLLYDKYKEKGLEIYSISLDKNNAQWLNAIKQDELIWSYHYTDLKSWDSPLVKLYNVKSIPYIILVDRKSDKTISGVQVNKLEEIIAEILN